MPFSPLRTKRPRVRQVWKPATRVAVETVRAATAKPGSIRQVIFACFGSDVFMAYRDEGIAGQV